MTHEEFVAAVLVGHAAVFSVGFAALIGFSAFSWPSKISIDGSKKVLESIRKRMTEQLKGELKELFEEGADVQQIGEIFGPSGERWQTRSVNLLESEQFGNVLFYFIESNAETVVDYRVLRENVEKCTFWVKYFSRSLYWLILPQIIILGILWAGDSICGWHVPEFCVKWSILIPVVTVLNCFIGLGMLMSRDRKNVEYGVKYG